MRIQGSAVVKRRAAGGGKRRSMELRGDPGVGVVAAARSVVSELAEDGVPG